MRAGDWTAAADITGLERTWVALATKGLSDIPVLSSSMAGANGVFCTDIAADSGSLPGSGGGGGSVAGNVSGERATGDSSGRAAGAVYMLLLERLVGWACGVYRPSAALYGRR